MWQRDLYLTLKAEFGEPVDITCKAKDVYVEYPFKNMLVPNNTDPLIVLEIFRHAQAGR